MNTVLIEGSVFSKQVASGISNYVGNLLDATVSGNDTSLLFKALVTNGYDRNIFIRELNLPKDVFISASSPGFISRIMTGVGVPGCRLFHSPYMFLPPRKTGRVNLLTVHDLINFHRGTGIRNALRKGFLSIAIKRADHFICISEHTKSELLRFFPRIDPSKTHVIHQGIDSIFFVKDTERLQLDTQKPFILYVGLRSDYKNFNALLNFYRHSEIRKEMDIVCVGGGAFTKAELELQRAFGLNKNIRHAGFISSMQLREYYRTAYALAYTSLAEGFGLPIIEALASGCPVICGNFSSMKEVSGGFGVLVDDFSTDSLEAAFDKVKRKTHAEKTAAAVYASAFTWQNTCRRTLLLYKSLIS